MKYIESWLTGLGLESVIPKLEANGINTPKKLAALSLRDMCEVVGVEDAEERKKLYFLVQRLQKILNSKASGEAGGGGSTAAQEVTEDVLSKASKSGIPSRSSASPKGAGAPESEAEMNGLSRFDSLSSTGDSTKSDQSEEDLRVLRRRARPSTAAAAVATAESKTNIDNTDKDADAGKMAPPTASEEPIKTERENSSQQINLNRNRSSLTRVSKSLDDPLKRGQSASMEVALKKLSFKDKGKDRGDRGKSGIGMGMRSSISNGSLSSQETLDSNYSKDSKDKGMGGGGARNSNSQGNTGQGKSSSSAISRLARPSLGLKRAQAGSGSGQGGPVPMPTVPPKGTTNSCVRTSADGLPPPPPPITSREPHIEARGTNRINGVNVGVKGSGGVVPLRFSQEIKNSGKINNSSNNSNSNSSSNGKARGRLSIDTADEEGRNIPAPIPSPSAIVTTPSNSSSSSPRNTHTKQITAKTDRSFERSVSPIQKRQGTSGASSSLVGAGVALRQSYSPPPSPPPLSQDGSESEEGSNENNKEEEEGDEDDSEPSTKVRVTNQRVVRSAGPKQVPAPRPVAVTKREVVGISGSTGSGTGSTGAARVRAVEDDDIIEDMPIRVVVRKRPLSRLEIGRGDRDAMEVPTLEEGAAVRGELHLHEPKTRVDLTKVVETTSFVFDDAFHEVDNNDRIYARTVKGLVDFAFQGGKSSCFAYGQTGSGKTFTLMGAQPENPLAEEINAGLYVLAARDIFRLLENPQYTDLSLTVSCFEIYGGKLFDLLNERKVVKCLEDAYGNVCTPGLIEREVGETRSLLESVAEAHEHRSVGSTGANETSSRSHLVMQLVLKDLAASKKNKKERDDKHDKAARRRSTFRDLSAFSDQEQSVVHGKVTFIDLAGSERGADTSNNSKQTRLEGAEINTSLLALKEVIRALANKALDQKGQNRGPRQVHTPFRGSKLTQVLKDSFVGEMTRTCMIACVSPAHTNCEHTLNTLRYADRVKEHTLDGPDSGQVESGNGPDSGQPENANRPRRRSSLGEAEGRAHSSQAHAPSLQRPSTGGPGGGGQNGQHLHKGSANSAYSPGRVPRPSTGGPGVAAPAGNRRQSTGGGGSGGGHQIYAAMGLGGSSNTQGQGLGQGGGGHAGSLESVLRSGPSSRTQLHEKGQEKGKGGVPPGGLAPSLFNKNNSPVTSSRKGRSPAASPAKLFSNASNANATATATNGGRPPVPRASLSPARGGQGGTGIGPGQSNSKSVLGISPARNRNVARVNSNSPARLQKESNPPRPPSAAEAAGSAARALLDEAKEESDVMESETESESESGSESPNVSNVSNVSTESLSEEGLARSLSLLSAHKRTIAETVEAMKVEMELVQEMEDSEERDVEHYMGELSRMLEEKETVVGGLRDELKLFREYRQSQLK